MNYFDFLNELEDLWLNPLEIILINHKNSNIFKII